MQLVGFGRTRRGVKLNYIHQIMVYADDDNVRSGSINNIKKNTKDLVAASKKFGQEINDEKSKSYLEIRMEDRITT
jgi:hypothetical protein